MKRIVILTLVVLCVAIDMNAQIQTGRGKILIAYFSHPLINVDNIDSVTGASVQISDGKKIGNVELVAGMIQRATGGDLFAIQTQRPYPQPQDFNVLRDYVIREQDARRMPELAAHVTNMASYDTIFIGYPIWMYTLPMVIKSFLEEYDLSGKTIIPFCVHGGSRWADSIERIKELEPRAKIEDGFIVSRNTVARSERDIASWLRRLGMVR
jgi:flavodoxin